MREREKDIKNETSVGEGKIEREIGVEERENHREGEGETGERKDGKRDRSGRERNRDWRERD